MARGAFAAPGAVLGPGLGRGLEPFRAGAKAARVTRFDQRGRAMRGRDWGIGAMVAGAVALGGCAPGPVAEGPVAPTLAAQWRAEGPQPGEKGCFARQTRPAVVETETEQVLVAAEKRDPATGEILRPATYRTKTHQKIVSPRAEWWFAAPCAADLTPEIVATLQRALAARGLYRGPVTGVLDEPTHRAIRAYQAPRGLDSATLSLRGAQELGLIAWLDDK